MNNLNKPFVVEFMGISLEDREIIINELQETLKNTDLNVSKLENFITSSYYKEVIEPSTLDLSISTKYQIIIEEIGKQLATKINEGKDIILVNGSLNERQLWNNHQYNLGNICDPQYFSMRDIYVNLSRELIDLLIIFCNKNDSKVQLSNLNNTKYNQYIFKLKPLYETSVNKCLILDSNIKNEDTINHITSEINKEISKKRSRSLRKML